jgi:hypothetical protein
VLAPLTPTLSPRSGTDNVKYFFVSYSQRTWKNRKYIRPRLSAPEELVMNVIGTFFETFLV